MIVKALAVSVVLALAAACPAQAQQIPECDTDAPRFLGQPATPQPVSAPPLSPPPCPP